MYNINKYLNEHTADTNIIGTKKNVNYCRVSSHGQKDDLERQIKYMKEKYPNNVIIKDIGSGINF